jgi:tetratricopeptide (TPR) repeat protein
MIIGCRIFLVVLFLAVVSGGPAFAGPKEDCEQNQDQDKRIAGCSRLIEQNPRNEVAYNNRAIAYGFKSDSERALADLIKSSEINPRYVWAHSNRCWIRINRRELELALQDCSRAIEIDAKHAEAHAHRCRVRLAQNATEQALADCNTAVTLGPKLALAYAQRCYVHAAKNDYAQAKVDCDAAVKLAPDKLLAWNARCWLNARRGAADEAIADCDKALTIDSRSVSALSQRCWARGQKRDLDRALADCNRAIEITSTNSDVWNNRCWILGLRKEYARAIDDCDKSISLGPASPYPWDNKCWINRDRGLADQALHDCGKAIELAPQLGFGYAKRCALLLGKGEHGRALDDCSKAIERDKTWAYAFIIRAKVYEARKELTNAVADYKRALAVPAREEEKSDREFARSRLSALDTSSAAPRPSPSVTNDKKGNPEAVDRKPGATASAKPGADVARQPALGRRVALVIGNSAYVHAGRLANPANDSRAIATSFRRLGFAEVFERYDLDLAKMGVALKEFGDHVADADWAVIYFAGHGIELNGTAYLIPTDAKLERDSHVVDETIGLGRVLDKVERARKLRLVILDACRNNPFAARMLRSSGLTRSISRGLAPVEPEGGVLVAYSAKHGTVAEDGTGTMSPFAEAFVALVEEPGVEINFLFRRVRDRVLTKTGRRQEPFLYGSLPAESLYFRPTANR